MSALESRTWKDYMSVDGKRLMVGSHSVYKTCKHTRRIRGKYTDQTAYQNTREHDICHGLTSWKYKAPGSTVIFNQVAKGLDYLTLFRSETGYTIDAYKAKLLNEARRKAFDKYSASDLSLGVDIAEIGQSIGMIGDSIARIASAFTALKKGKVKKALHSILGYPKGKPTPKTSHTIPGHLRGVPSAKHSSSVSRRMRKGSLTAANAWLELTYGWTPLVSQIEDYADVAQKGLSGPCNSGQIKTSVSRDVNITGRRSSFPGMRINANFRFSAGVCLNYQITDPRAAALERLGLSNAASVAWELVPYSFVVDWVMPIGDTLKMLNAYQGTRINGSNFTKVVLQAGSSDLPTDPETKVYLNLGSRSIKRLDFRRSLNETGRSISFPDFEPVLGTKRLLSGISLLIQSFIRSK